MGREWFEKDLKHLRLLEGKVETRPFSQYPYITIVATNRNWGEKGCVLGRCEPNQWPTTNDVHTGGDIKIFHLRRGSFEKVFSSVTLVLIFKRATNDTHTGGDIKIFH